MGTNFYKITFHPSAYRVGQTTAGCSTYAGEARSRGWRAGGGPWRVLQMGIVSILRDDGLELVAIGAVFAHRLEPFSRALPRLGA
jgi:hypothetical protein